MAATTESRLKAGLYLLDEAKALLSTVAGNAIAAGDLREIFEQVMRLVDETMPRGSQLDPFEPAPTDPDGSEPGFASALLPPED